MRGQLSHQDSTLEGQAGQEPGLATDVWLAEQASSVICLWFCFLGSALGDILVSSRT